MNELTKVLQGVISQAAKTLPKETGETARAGQRWTNAGQQTVILCDVSGSMDESAGSKRKIGHLRDALQECWPDVPGARLFEFCGGVRSLAGPADISEPSGGTALHLALQAACELRPARTLVITDGQPDDENAALATAQILTGRIDVIYCGPDRDTKAIAFLQKLARIGSGECVVADVVKSGGGSLRLGCRKLLGLPAPGGAK